MLSDRASDHIRLKDKSEAVMYSYVVIRLIHQRDVNLKLGPARSLQHDSPTSLYQRV